MNCALRAVVRTALKKDLKVFTVNDGFQGLIEDDIHYADSSTVAGIINQGGTILGTARSKDFLTKEGRAKAMKNIRGTGIDALAVIGGDGSFHGAEALYKEFNFPTVGIPGTIDNDIAGTDNTIGFDTAVNTAVEAIDKIRDTATSHERLFVIEVMGRDSGFIAVETAVAGGAEAVLIPERPFDLQVVCQKLEKGLERGKRSSIIVIAEGAGGAHEIAYKIKIMLPNMDIRVTVIGHLQRGGAPTAMDRVLASLLGEAAVDLLLEGKYGQMVGLVSGQIKHYPLNHAWKHEKNIDNKILHLTDVLI